MKSLILEAPGDLQLRDSPEVAAPQAGEALVRVHRVGVCGTDIHAFGGKQPFFNYPRLIGHELGVEVLEIGANVTHIRAGDKCAVEPYLNCQKCIACRRGKGNCCAQIQVLGVHIDGGARERFILPARKLHPGNQLDFEQLALVETLGIGAHAVSRAEVEPGEWVLVIGAGPIGLGVMQFARQAGAQVIALDQSRLRLDFCRQKWSISHTVLAGDAALDTVRDLTNGDLPSAVFDATGHSASMNRAFDFVAPGGRLVFVGLHQGQVTFSDPDFHKKELTLLATRNALPQDFRSIIAGMERGETDTSPWVTHRAPLSDVAAQFEAWTRPENGVLKAIIEL
ncbi:2-desacetyl-2-hydroxyethyl bacteriochlorophyllide A dehydrogenase [Abditibacterium utsteinense]|uniref:2-desacetyl-2-hydroxyethyl bacteriochlorophyllide A dehydrogenase n=1 Tax=Abditibacterium utsteinense TaxID=1960156 RepID=A0A2S8SRV7_9BACT|nr:zinc-binding alcohol dehydrogenase family protein [Abditibacterium utsteinense]PQV63552.1 2-desacetyl-2-hydroxyethyl bacteriochlorophyllide A dehydrogenase [Abditibacterium utsteinense]